MGAGVRNSSVTVAGSVGTGESKTEPRTSTKCRLRDGSSPIAFRNNRHRATFRLYLGQLNCQGLNRALALPAVIGKQFGRPDAIFAPDPAQSKEDYGHPYNYVRPLATIEPTTIAFGLPIDASIGVSNLDALRQKLESPAYRSALLVVAREHVDIAKLARLLIADHGGDPSVVPDWQGGDFDSIYVVRITHTGTASAVAFDQRQEGLDGQPTACPGQPPR